VISPRIFRVTLVWLALATGPGVASAGSDAEWGSGKVQRVPVQTLAISTSRSTLPEQLVIPTQVPIAPVISVTSEAGSLPVTGSAAMGGSHGKTLETNNLSHTLLPDTDNYTRLASREVVSYKKPTASVSLPRLAPIKTGVIEPKGAGRVPVEYIVDVHRQEAPGFWMTRPLPATDRGPAPNAWAAPRN
jgi:hypothetical protein